MSKNTRQDIESLKEHVVGNIQKLDVLLENILKLNDNPTSEIYFRPENYINLNDQIEQIIVILSELAATVSHNMQPIPEFWINHRKEFEIFLESENSRLFTLKVAIVKPLYDNIQAAYEMAVSFLDLMTYEN